MRYGSEPLSVLFDSRMAVRGLGISTFTERLVAALTADAAIGLTRWQAQGEWGHRAKLATLGRSGLFDVSPRLDPRTRHFDVAHYVSNIGPVFPGKRSVVTLHDLLYRRSRRARDRLFGFLLEQSLPRAGIVVAVSERTRAEVRRSWPSLQGRLEMIPHGMRRLPLPVDERTHILAFGGGSDPRKRVDLAVAAYGRYRRLAANPRPLVVLARAGLTTPQRQALDAQGARLVDNATSAEVDQLLARAAALVYTTTTEGFGLPILEAAEVGTPVVMDRTADVAQEVVGRHCVMVDGADPTAWALAIVQAVEGGPVPGALELPDWEEVARRYVELYRDLARPC